MRPVGEIVEAVQEQQAASEEELRLALLCLFYDGQLACPSDFEGASALKLRLRAQNNFERRFQMLRADPATYLGPRWTPGTDANTEGRCVSKAVLNAALSQGAWIPGPPPGRGHWWICWRVPDGAPEVCSVAISPAVLNPDGRLLLKCMDGLAYQYEPYKDRITHHQPMITPPAPEVL